MQLAQIQTIPEIVNVLKVLMTGALAFFLAFVITPVWTKILYKYKIGIKIKENSVDGKKLTYVNRLHADKSGTPTTGGRLPPRYWNKVICCVLATGGISW